MKSLQKYCRFLGNKLRPVWVEYEQLAQLTSQVADITHTLSKEESVHRVERQKPIASNAMTRTQTIICFSVREPGAALSPLAIRFECVHISVFC